MSADRPSRPARRVRLVVLRKEAAQSVLFGAGRAPALHAPVATRPGGCGNKVRMPDAAGRNRWQCPDRNAAHGPEHLQVLRELHRAGGPVGMVRKRAESKHVQELVAQGHVALQTLPVHYNTEFEASLTPQGRRYVGQLRGQQTRAGNRAQQSLLAKARDGGTDGDDPSAGGGGSPVGPRRGGGGASGQPPSPRYARVHDGYGGQDLRPVRVHDAPTALRKCGAAVPVATALVSPLPGASAEALAGSGLREWTVGPYTASLLQGRGAFAIVIEGGDLPMAFHLVCPAPEMAEKIAADAAAILAKGGLPPKDGLFRRRGRLLV